MTTCEAGHAVNYNALLSAEQRKIVHELRNRLSTLTLHLTPDALAAAEDCQRLLDALCGPPVTYEEHDQYEAIVCLPGRRVLILAEPARPGIPTGGDVTVGILNCELEGCGEAFAIDPQVPNRKRFHSKSCADHASYKEGLVRTNYEETERVGSPRSQRN